MVICMKEGQKHHDLDTSPLKIIEEQNKNNIQSLKNALIADAGVSESIQIRERILEDLKEISELLAENIDRSKGVPHSSNPISAEEPLQGRAVFRDAPKSNSKSGYAKRDPGYEYLILKSLSLSSHETPISKDFIEAVLKVYDPSRKPTSLDSKLARMRDNELAQWREPYDRSLTDAGRQKLKEIERRVASRKNEIDAMIFAELAKLKPTT